MIVRLSFLFHPMSAREFQELGRPEAGGRAFEKRYGAGMNELASRAAFAWLLARRIPMVRVLRCVIQIGGYVTLLTLPHTMISHLRLYDSPRPGGQMHAKAWMGTSTSSRVGWDYTSRQPNPACLSAADRSPEEPHYRVPGSCHGASYDGGDRLRRHKGGVDDEPITGAKIGPMARHHYLTFIVLPALIRRLLQMHGHESLPDHSFSPENHAETTGTDVVAAGMLFRLMVSRDAFRVLAYPDFGPLPTLAPGFRDPGVSCARSMALHTDRCMLMRNLRAKARQPAIT
ncbi:hypothetical protein BO83DRAFT_412262 [Aspergillus eucalypticola CBS 122712]|uniref:Uncharacterized protein n=1 Tax=Aspergillus eucalypticola (strain CBS 122712 / IBT 29274) TaxID=1448314 RepID=A0A317ULX9_ASPEC|nr:uncharacterized protein BO83DRAFT_412262 [Aspergillus eucalypticola CBS 122712]PWY62963.1 hypothetical protein BO83DRAFT_412262 [Aspergillus eucalypticola CBS 122712]